MASCLCLLVALCLPMLAGIVSSDRSHPEGISALDVCSQDPSFLLQGEMVLVETFYLLPKLRETTFLPEQTTFFSYTVTPDCPDRPPVA